MSRAKSWGLKDFPRNFCLTFSSYMTYLLLTCFTSNGTQKTNEGYKYFKTKLNISKLICIIFIYWYMKKKISFLSLYISKIFYKEIVEYVAEGFTLLWRKRKVFYDFNWIFWSLSHLRYLILNNSKKSLTAGNGCNGSYHIRFSFFQMKWMIKLPLQRQTMKNIIKQT